MYVLPVLRYQHVRPLSYHTLLGDHIKTMLYNANLSS